MKLWLLTRNPVDDDPIYDTVDGLVVRAPSEMDARMLAFESPGDEGGETWKDGDRSSCELIGEGPGEMKILLVDFHHG